MKKKMEKIILFFMFVFIFQNVKTCDFSCDSCSCLLSSFNSSTDFKKVCLNKDISTSENKCLTESIDIVNKELECNGYKIKGNGLEDDLFNKNIAFKVDSAENFLIQNCIISDFVTIFETFSEKKTSDGLTIMNNTFSLITKILNIQKFENIIFKDNQISMNIGNKDTEIEVVSLKFAKNCYFENNVNNDNHHVLFMIQNSRNIEVINNKKILFNLHESIEVKMEYNFFKGLYCVKASGVSGGFFRYNNFHKCVIGLLLSDVNNTVEHNFFCNGVGFALSLMKTGLPNLNNNTCRTIYEVDVHQNVFFHNCANFCPQLTNTCTCTSCETCNKLIEEENCGKILLENDVEVMDEVCIKSRYMRGIIFDCQGYKIKKKQDGKALYAFMLNPSYSEFKNCIFEDLKRAFTINEQHLMYYNEVIFSNLRTINVKIGIDAVLTNKNTKVTNIQIYNCTFEYLEFGVYIKEGEGFNIFNNIFYQLNPREDDYGIKLIQNMNSKISNNNINSTGKGIFLVGNNIEVFKNIITNTLDAGIEEFCENCFFSDNTISNVFYGFHIKERNGQYTRNVITKSAKYGFYTGLNLKHINFFQNTVCGSMLYSFYVQYGLDKDMDSLNITGNENTCDSAYQFKDRNVSDIGCSKKCSINRVTCYCNGCQDCTAKLNSDFCSTVELTQDIQLNEDDQDCLVFEKNIGMYKKIFDCNNFKINGADKQNSQTAFQCKFSCGYSTIKNCEFNNFATAIYINGDKMNITNNKILNCKTGINVRKFEESFISNNYISNIEENAIKVSFYSRELIINNNIIENVEEEPIVLLASSSSVITSNNISNSDEACISVKDSKFVSVSENILSLCEKGVIIDEQSDSALLHDNYICNTYKYDIEDLSNSAIGDSNTCNNKLVNYKDGQQEGCSLPCPLSITNKKTLANVKNGIYFEIQIIKDGGRAEKSFFEIVDDKHSQFISIEEKTGLLKGTFFVHKNTTFFFTITLEDGKTQFSKDFEIKVWTDSPYDPVLRTMFYICGFGAVISILIILIVIVVVIVYFIKKNKHKDNSDSMDKKSLLELKKKEEKVVSIEKI